MVNVKKGINWYNWVRENIRYPDGVSDMSTYLIYDIFDVCNSKHELAIGLWVALDMVTLMPVENIEKLLDEAIDEVEE